MWAKIHHAMNALGIKEGEAKSIYACLAAIYHLGVAGVAKGNTSTHVLLHSPSLLYTHKIIDTGKLCNVKSCHVKNISSRVILHLKYFLEVL